MKMDLILLILLTPMCNVTSGRNTLPSVCSYALFKDTAAANMQRYTFHITAILVGSWTHRWNPGRNSEPGPARPGSHLSPARPGPGFRPGPGRGLNGSLKLLKLPNNQISGKWFFSACIKACFAKIRMFLKDVYRNWKHNSCEREASSHFFEILVKNVPFSSI